ncbi:fumarylacetoacetate hydrolase family protein [Lactiplantibacillus mudanjiangensis]|uniref:Fumarylacetoacetate hydrolase [Lactobacillus alimentarius DSM] n=1 Tax=Lactiplantibacillus mudanjiangensis TaxID=1296538 RepID=A0A660DUN4_9LACO|nr:fumarylacetoacetate hydrolase family protein [Lactiplantibacillus mudanjiangensis]VDG22582.1 fumarylacetoacetate hydrolase [Lactobacillus alimentarius DSM] [Lactiplantibacillus mudanjiangensis]VDG26881.1 fumarylacetoacetate hydrolase [Lactobacillus alimentarius DSM] [Lactiplantibacillus mudanjiangensis]
MKLAMINKRPAVINGQQFQFIKQAQDVQSLLTDLTTDFELEAAQPLTGHTLEAPIQASRQIFAVGFNYRDHLNELKTQAPKVPNIFTKFVSSITGPVPTVQIPSPKTDWETELVIVIGQGGRNIDKSVVTDHIAGYMVGQDLSDRQLQFANDQPQFSLAKSYENFSPVGPWLTTPDELTDLGDLTITTTLNGVEKQHSQLKQLIFDPADLVNYLSTITELYPGDLIFTGTPGGVGTGRDPQEFIQPGDHLVSEIEELGKLDIQFKA